MTTLTVTSASAAGDRDAPPSADATLLDACAAGDRDALRVLIERHEPVLRAYVTARIGANDADDVLAETFAAAWRSAARFDAGAESARPWLFGIASRLLRRQRSREAHWQRAAAAASITAPEEAPDPTAGLVDPALRAALASLRTGEREVLLLVALADLTVADAARALGIREGTARVRLHRARRRLSAELGDLAPDTDDSGAHDDDDA
jgi:RNA polymerase sigma-70 factor (ECF subfamily)